LDLAVSKVFGSQSSCALPLIKDELKIDFTAYIIHENKAAKFYLVNQIPIEEQA